jgi:hypothetical protein
MRNLRNEREDVKSQQACKATVFFISKIVSHKNETVKFYIHKERGV